MSKLWLRIASVLALIVLSGCNSARTDARILEDLAFSYAVSYDLIENEERNRLRITVVYPGTDPAAKLEEHVLTTTARSSKEARTKLSRQTDRTLVSGQLRTILFNSAMAENGLWQYIDTLIRDPAIGSRTKIALVSGSATALLQRTYPGDPRTGRFVDRMLLKEALVQGVPEVHMHHWVRDRLDDGIDPVAPILKEDGDTVILDGIGLFRDDEYKVRLRPDQAFILAMLSGRQTQSRTSIDLGDGEGDGGDETVMLSSVRSKPRVKIRKSAEDAETVFEADITVNLRASVLEYIGDRDLSADKERRVLTRKMADYLKREAEVVLKTMQEHQTDCIGIGQQVRNKVSYEEWTSMDWHDVFGRIRTKVSINLKISDYGTLP